MQKLNREGVNFSGMNYPSLPSMTTPNPMMGGMGMNPSATPYSNTGQQFMYNNNSQLMNNMMPSTGQVMQSDCVLLSNLFDETIDLAEEPNFFKEIYEDVHEECSQFGKIYQLWIDEKSPIGNIWIKFDNNDYQAANVTIQKLNMR